MKSKARNPIASIVVVTLGGTADLAVALPGILNQTIAGEIELVIVAKRGCVSDSDLRSISGLHSVILVEANCIGNRSRDAVLGIAVATAPFLALHENHTRSEPETYDRLVQAFDDKTGATCPVIYAANAEMLWGRAMYSVAHGHAAPPVPVVPQKYLVLHSAMYRREFLLKAGSKFRQEEELQSELFNEGLHLKFVPGTVVWHINEARPLKVLSDTFRLGRSFGFSRKSKMSLTQRLLRAGAFPMLAAISATRIMKTAKRSQESSANYLTSWPIYALTGAVYGIGEAIGYLDTHSTWTTDNELHEFHIRSRLNGHTPAKKWLVDAIALLPQSAA